LIRSGQLSRENALKELSLEGYKYEEYWYWFCNEKILIESFEDDDWKSKNFMDLTALQRS
jgi:hypothetical protein